MVFKLLGDFPLKSIFILLCYERPFTAAKYLNCVHCAYIEQIVKLKF
jgi:hypothetical protein